MKILLDEQLPTKLKYRFENTGFEVSTVRDMDWLGKKNGELLKLLTLHKYKVFITNDKNMNYQQKLAELNLYVININTGSNRYEDVVRRVDAIKVILAKLKVRTPFDKEGNYISLAEE